MPINWVETKVYNLPKKRKRKKAAAARTKSQVHQELSISALERVRENCRMGYQFHL